MAKIHLIFSIDFDFLGWVVGLMHALGIDFILSKVFQFLHASKLSFEEEEEDFLRIVRFW